METGDHSFKDRAKRSGREALALAGRLVLVILPVIAAGILLLLLFLQNTTIHLIIFGFTSTVCLGLLAGFLSRWILKKRSPALRFLVAAVGLLAGLVVMYMVSSGMLGLSPYIRNAIDWYGLVQIGFGLGAAFIALNGFRRKQAPLELVVSAPISTPAASPSLVVPAAAAAAITPVPQTKRGAAKKSRSTTKKATEKKKVVVGRKTTAKAAPSGRRSRKKVTLAAFDEHRCPYCLGEVKRNDPRGVVVCPVCKAYHHKDCWDITGRCQVPHDSPLEI